MFPQEPLTCDELGPREGDLALVPAGRAMLAGLDRIPDAPGRAAALRAALVDNPVSAQPIWAAVEAWGGVRRPEDGPVLVTHRTTAERLLAADAAHASGGGACALLSAVTARPSQFLRRPDVYLESRPRGPTRAAAERVALVYLETRGGGRDVHVPMLVDAVLGGVLGEWLGVGEQARASQLLSLANHVACAAMDPWPTHETAAQVRSAVGALWSALQPGACTRLESYWVGALATHDRLSARAAALDTLVTLAGPFAIGLRSALRQILAQGRIARPQPPLPSSESGTRPALPSFDAWPAPALLGLAARAGSHPAIGDGERVLISLCHVLRSASAHGQRVALPWLPERLPEPCCEAIFDGVLRALGRCDHLESRGQSGFRFAALAQPESASPTRRWPFAWWR